MTHKLRWFAVGVNRRPLYVNSQRPFRCQWTPRRTTATGMRVACTDNERNLAKSDKQTFQRGFPNPLDL
eukprot:2406165-Amphidinium_carterae.1